MKSTFVIALLTLASTMRLFRPAAVNPAYSVSVTIRPTSPANPYQLLAKHRTAPPHTCNVAIRDISTHKTLKTMRLTLIPGKEESQMAFAGGNQIMVTAMLSTNGERASWEVSMSRDGAAFMSQKSDTELRVATNEN